MKEFICFSVIAFMKEETKELIKTILRNEELIMKALNIEIPERKIEYKPLVKKQSPILPINEKSGVVPIKGVL